MVVVIVGGTDETGTVFVTIVCVAVFEGGVQATSETKASKVAANVIYLILISVQDYTTKSIRWQQEY